MKYKAEPYTCPNSARKGTLVLMLGPQAWEGSIGLVTNRNDGIDYDWLVSSQEDHNIPCWEEELLLLPTP